MFKAVNEETYPLSKRDRDPTVHITKQILTWDKCGEQKNIPP
jgi:hypothetical protein